MEKLSLPLFCPLPVTSQEAKGKNTLLSPLCSPPSQSQAKAAHRVTQVMLANKDEAVESWVLIASCFLEHGVMCCEY